MDNSNQNEYKEKMLELSEVYQRELSASLIKIYWKALKPLTIDQLKSAIDQHISDPNHGSFFPKPADLIRITFGNDQTFKEEAAIAWDLLRSELTAHKPEVGPKTAAAISGIGGLYNLRRLSMYELDRYKSEFLSNYTANMREESQKLISNQGLIE